jgi:sortase A
VAEKDLDRCREGAWRVRSGILVLWFASLSLIGSGLAVIAVIALPALLGAEGRGGAASASEGGGSVPVALDRNDVAVAPAAPVEVFRPREASRGEGRERVEKGPEDHTLKLTIPKMARVEGVEIPSVPGSDEETLKDHAAIHLEGTGFPWQDGSNVYIAGHRLGYPATGSFLAFYDLDALESGDEVQVQDADGKRYVYRVFKEFIVDPTELSVTRPVRGKDVLTLQTCTLPDYSRRLIVQAEKVA